MSLSKKLTIWVSGIVLVGLLVLIIVSNNYTNNLLKERENAEMMLLGRTIQSAIESELDATKITVQMIANDPETQRLFYERNREGLLAKYDKSYSLIQEDVAQFQFHLPDSTSFLRLHDPTKFGDSLKDTRMTVNKANESGQIVSGLEKGKAGLGLRVVVPIKYNEEAIGSVEFGKGFDETFLSGLKDQFGGDAYFIYTLNPDDQTGEISKQNNELLASTVDEDKWLVDDDYIPLLFKGEIQHVLTNGGDNGVVLVPCEDFNGDVIGFIKVVNDRSMILTQIKQARLVIYAISIVLLLVILVSLTLLIIKFIKKPLAEITDIARSVAGGNFNVTIDVDSKDEIGVVANAFSETVLMFDHVVNDVDSLIKATNQGNLLKRGDETKYQGSYKSLIHDVNTLADGLVDYFNAIPFPTVLLDLDYNLKFANTQAMKLVDSDEETMIGKKCYDLLDCTVCKTTDCPGQKAVQSGLREISSALKDDLHLSVHNTPIKDNDGNARVMLELVVDQTEIIKAQKKAEDAYEKSKQQAELIHNQMQEAEKQVQIQKEMMQKSDQQAQIIQKQIELTKKQTDHQAKEVSELMLNIEKLSQGDLSISINEIPYDDDTRDIAEIYRGINKNLVKSVDVIKLYIAELSEHLKQMANKDFTGGITREYLGDFIDIKLSINHILKQFNEIFLDISQSSGEVESGATQVAQASQSLAQGASEQASSTEEISASITLVAEQTKENAISANKASVLSNKTKDDAKLSNDQMADMLRAMEAINDSSEKIASIIKVIDGIAFQTNILSLNAAVEAARAGVHGRGFAVVAEEVKILATRSAQAAKETTDLIEVSIHNVEEGNQMAKKTAESLNGIITDVMNVASTVETIAKASNDQATAINEINLGIEQISNVIQRNAAVSEESASISDEMSSQAGHLQDLITSFTLK